MTIFGKVNRLLGRVKTYYLRFGFRKTIWRIVRGLFGSQINNYNQWRKVYTPDAGVLNRQRKTRFPYEPKISIVIPLYKTPKEYLEELIKSIQAQTYSNWEICFSDGSGENSPLTEILKKYQEKDARIKSVYTGKQLQISENTNAALEISSGDYIAFADHDDLLAPEALYECISVINKNRETDFIYTDEDKIDMSGRHYFMPHFKPDMNIDMLRSLNYICHLIMVKKSLIEEVGNLNHAFNGAQDYDFVLRCVERAKCIKHIAKVLYHWRAHEDSTAEDPESKLYAFEAGKRAIEAHYERVGIDAEVEDGILKGIYRSKYRISGEPLISIVIPNKDHTKDLDKCISSIESKSTYKNYEFIIVENNSTEEETFLYYKKLEEKCPRAKVVKWPGEGFNYPSINNYGVECAKGEYILFLNNDTEIINDNCLEELLGYCQRADVGAVGAKLYYEDGTIQHAGVVIGIGGVAGHSFVGFPGDHPGYFGRASFAQNYSAVTAACMMVKRSVFQEVKGFEEAFAVAFNDVDLCMKICYAGYRIVYNPYAELTHFESKSRGYEDTPEKIARFQKEIQLFKDRWGEFLEKGDPCYSPNLSLDRNDFAIKNH